MATDTDPDTYQLELATGAGPRFRTVLRTPARACSAAEVPVISLSGLTSASSTAASRAAVAAAVRRASTHTGFFYIRDHGIPAATVARAEAFARRLFALPDALKERVARAKSAYFNGWARLSSGQISPSETRDRKEGYMFRYDPQLDLRSAGPVPDEVRSGLMCEDFVWALEDEIPGFKEAMVAYWRECLALARALIGVFALAMGAEETYFDKLVTYPGSDAVLNFYPANDAPAGAPIDVGIGAHTDIQAFTILWQDAVGGLQVLDSSGQWLSVPPIADTFVVNIGDFLARLSNDHFQSTVHRVFNYSREDRLSMPFFFGLNFNEKCKVLDSCTSADDPPKYEPISCGEWCRLRIGKSVREP